MPNSANLRHSFLDNKNINNITAQKWKITIEKGDFLHYWADLSLSIILRIFLIFPKFQPKYSYKRYSYKTKRV